jgi:hypothetical protein
MPRPQNPMQGALRHAGMLDSRSSILDDRGQMAYRAGGRIQYPVSSIEYLIEETIDFF